MGKKSNVLKALEEMIGKNNKSMEWISDKVIEMINESRKIKNSEKEEMENWYDKENVAKW